MSDDTVSPRGLVRLRLILRTYDPEPTAIVIGFILAALGFVLLIPETRSSAVIDPYFKIPMGILFTGVGVLRVVSILYLWPSVWDWLGLVTLCIWAWITLLVGLGNGLIGALATYGGVTLASLWVFWRTVVDNANARGIHKRLQP